MGSNPAAFCGERRHPYDADSVPPRSRLCHHREQGSRPYCQGRRSHSSCGLTTLQTSFQTWPSFRGFHSFGELCHDCLQKPISLAGLRQGSGLRHAPNAAGVHCSSRAKASVDARPPLQHEVKRPRAGCISAVASCARFRHQTRQEGYTLHALCAVRLSQQRKHRNNARGREFEMTDAEMESLIEVAMFQYRQAVGVRH